MKINTNNIVSCEIYLKRINHSVRLVKKNEIKVFDIKLQSESEYLEHLVFPSIKVTNTYYNDGFCYYNPHIEIETTNGVKTVWFDNKQECADYYNEITKCFLDLKR